MEQQARTSAAPQGREVADHYDDISGLLTELFGGSLHEGYWESPDDTATMAEASQRLTDLMTAFLGVGPGDRVLDIGCGTGGPAIRLAETTGASVVGITNSPVQAAAAAERARESGLDVEFRCEDATSLRHPDGEFDGVLMIESIFHLPDRQEALRQVARVLKPGGRVAITDILDRSAAPMDRAVADLADHSTAQGRSPVVAAPVRLSAYDELLARAGLEPVESRDISEHTVARTIACVRRKLDGDRADLVRRFGSAVVEQYASVVPLLESAGFGYGAIAAARPRS